MTDSSAALTAAGPVHYSSSSASLVHVWPCSAPLQSSLRLPFPACVVPKTAALTPSSSALHSSVCPSRGPVGTASFCAFQSAQKHSNLIFLAFDACHSRTQWKRKHVPTTHSNRYLPCNCGLHCNCGTSAHVGQPCCFQMFFVSM
jgi:hypothetical protein